MNREPTLYDVLGVSRTATAAEIRAAYLWLMKQHHPDVRASLGGSQGPGMAPLINRCYATLRDLRKRAAYDAQLDREAHLWSASRQLAHFNASAAAAERPFHPRTLLVAACLFCAPIALVWLAAPQREPSSLAAFDWLSPDPPVAPEQAIAPLPTDTEIRRQALVATSVTADQAVVFSRACYNDARQQGLSSAAALCIAFDESFLSWWKAPGLIDSLPPYFGDRVVSFRETEAMAPFGSEGEQQLDEIRKRAFLATLDQANAAASGDGLPELPAISEAAPADTAMPSENAVQTPVQ
jgi:hypothetical protein